MIFLAKMAFFELFFCFRGGVLCIKFAFFHGFCLKDSLEVCGSHIRTGSMCVEGVMQMIKRVGSFVDKWDKVLSG